MISSLRAIIIDDERNSRHSLRQKLSVHCPEVTIIGECENGEEAEKAVAELEPDLLFLDVEMPRMNGFTLLQQLKHRNFEVIFVTAYDYYAIKAIKFSALDYLVKPVEVEELKTAVKKAAQKRMQPDDNERLELLLQNLMNEKRDRQRIAIPSMKGLQFIKLDDIIYLEAHSNYTVVYLGKETKITVSKTLKDFEELLPVNVFIRIHHSYIINSSAVEKYIRGDGGQVVMKNGVTLDVSKRKKSDFLKAIGY